MWSNDHIYQASKKYSERGRYYRNVGKPLALWMHKHKNTNKEQNNSQWYALEAPTWDMSIWANGKLSHFYVLFGNSLY